MATRYFNRTCQILSERLVGIRMVSEHSTPTQTVDRMEMQKSNTQHLLVYLACWKLSLLSLKLDELGPSKLVKTPGPELLAALGERPGYPGYRGMRAKSKAQHWPTLEATLANFGKVEISCSTAAQRQRLQTCINIAKVTASVINLHFYSAKKRGFDKFEGAKQLRHAKTTNPFWGCTSCEQKSIWPTSWLAVSPLPSKWQQTQWTSCDAANGWGLHCALTCSVSNGLGIKSIQITDIYRGSDFSFLLDEGKWRCTSLLAECRWPELMSSLPQFMHRI